MPFAALERPRVLVVAGPERIGALGALFAVEPLSGWEMLTADSFGQAHHQLHHVPFDLVLVSHDALRRDGQQALAWLTSQLAAPVLFVGDDQAVLYAQAYEMGVSACLPWTLAVDHPPLLHAVMRQTAQAWAARKLHQRTHDELSESRRRVDRLVQMIWRLTPRHDDHWYSERHVLERLQEEISRCQRHQVPLSIAVGQVQASREDAESALPEWAAEAIVRGKRRCDIVGQYGKNGFLLLMVHTPKPGGVTCCRRLQVSLDNPAQHTNGPHMPVRSFFGIASMDNEQCTPQALLRIAQENLDTARHEAISRSSR